MNDTKSPDERRASRAPSHEIMFGKRQQQTWPGAAPIHIMRSGLEQVIVGVWECGWDSEKGDRGRSTNVMFNHVLTSTCYEKKQEVADKKKKTPLSSLSFDL